MKIVIGHYHLNPGGVTKIIESQVKSLVLIDPSIEISVICGGWSQKSFSFPKQVKLAVYKQLHYLENKSYKKEELELKHRTINQLFKEFANTHDVIHFHNATLGKNPLISLVLYQLALEGSVVINHAHDFAEDRAANMSFLQQVIADNYQIELRKVLYPDLESYYMGVINSSDEKRVLSFDFPKERLHKWLNPVSIPALPQNASAQQSRKRIAEAFHLDESKQIVCYPVRVIRRKNIGEFMLLAWLFADKSSWLVTQPPNNPVEIEFYNKWVSFSQEQGINVIFEAGQRASFTDVMMGSDLCITTSIMEGFGMVFVEPWFWGTPVKGRAIPAVMNDLIHCGIHFPFLYNEIWVDYKGDKVDFGKLSETAQREVIINYKQTDKSEIIMLNPHLAKILEPVNEKVIENNKKNLTISLSEESYGQTLFELYKNIS